MSSIRVSVRALALAAAVPAIAAALAPSPVGAQATRLFREPAVSQRLIAFEYAGDIWVVPREGGDARRITSSPGIESDPHFSPDGTLLAFTGEYGGNQDVYVVPVSGGEPRRLTWHPGPDQVQGWTPDGKRVVFSSGRTSAPSPAPRLWTVSLEGGLPEVLPMPRAAWGSISPDGRTVAYSPVAPWENVMRNYRGGQNRPVWLLDLKSYDLSTPPWTDSRDWMPDWVGNTVYFLSDRDWAVNVWSYEPATKQLKQLTHYRDYDVRSLSTGGGAVVYEQAGWIHLLDPASAQDRKVDIRVSGDFPWAMERWVDVSKNLAHPSLSPTGARALFEGRGDIYTVPVEKGSWRDLTPQSSGSAERAPAWSPDGKHLAWFSDASGEYQLVIGDQDGAQKPRIIALQHPTFYYTPAWSPDGKKILFTDADLVLWVVDVATGKETRVDNDNYIPPTRTMDPVWSPDSRWIAYAKRLDNFFHAIFVYNLEDGKVRQLTDGMSDAVSPAFDASGKYLWFLASTDYGLSSGWLDMSSYDHPTQRGLYLAVLAKGTPSPLLPESDEDKGIVAAGEGTPAPAGPAKPGQGKPAAAPKPAVSAVTIDFDGFMDRVLAADVPLREYDGLQAGTAGQVFFGEHVPNRAGVLHRFDLKDRKDVTFVSAVADYTLSADGKKLLYEGALDSGPAAGRGNDLWFVVDADKGPPAPGSAKPLATAALRMRLDPQAEWKQIFREAWRIQRDYLYVKNMHGADWNAVWAMYSPLVADVRSRDDLNYLMDLMQGELTVGHSFVRGGDLPRTEAAPIGLLGADLAEADGRYKITKIYTGENWNPDLRAPLAAPGVDVHEGDYILEVNGVDLRAPTSPYSLFEGTVGRPTLLRVSARPTTEGSRLVTVVPIANELGLRQRAWIEDNRRKVDQLSGGKLAYVWLPNTGLQGYTNFNRYYFAQQDREGAVVDERFNQGGSAADYIVDALNRKLHGYFNNPVGNRRPWTSPGAGIWGPKVMIINEMSGSGGDLMPYMFHQMGIGPLVGTKTWGGLVGIWDAPPLVDGGSITAPRGGFFNLQDQWDVENKGVAPDIPVEMTPKDVIAGRDPQLEAAVAEAMKELAAHPFVRLKEPPAPTPVRRPGTAAATSETSSNH